MILLLGVVALTILIITLGGQNQKRTNAKLTDNTSPTSYILDLVENPTVTPTDQYGGVIWSYPFNPINISTDSNYDIRKFFSNDEVIYITQQDYYFYYPIGYALDLDYVYFPTDLANILSINLQSGDVVWKSELQGYVLGVGKDTVFVLTGNNRVYVLNKSSGTDKWKILLEVLVDEIDYLSVYPKIIPLDEYYVLPVITDCPNGRSLRFLRPLTRWQKKVKVYVSRKVNRKNRFPKIDFLNS